MNAALLARHAFPFAVFAAAMYTFYPGHLSFDSAFMYWQARSGEFYNVSPSTMPILWRGMEAIWPGSGGMFAIQVALFIGGVWAACCAFFRHTIERLLGSLYVLLGTPAFLVVTHLWTDAVMIACLTAGCGLILIADRVRSQRWLIAAVPLLVVGGMVRHNAAPALVPLAMWWWLVHARVSRSAWQPRTRTLLIAALVCAIGVAGISRFLDRMIVKHNVSTFNAVQVFDLAGVSIQVDELLLPAFLVPEGFTLETLRKRFVPYNNFPLFNAPDGVKEVLWEGSITPSEVDELGKAWRSALLNHPVAYLNHRFETTSWLFSRYRNDRPIQLAIVEEVGSYQGNPLIHANSTAAHRFAISWYTRAIGWWGFAPVSYILGALIVLGVNWRARTTPIGQCALALAASGLAYVAPLPFVVPSAELRYSGWLFAATSIAVLATIAPLAARARWTARSEGEGVAGPMGARTR